MKSLSVTMVVLLVVVLLAGGTVARTHACGNWQDERAAIAAQNAALDAQRLTDPATPQDAELPARPWYC